MAVGSYAFMGGLKTSLVAAGSGRKWTARRIPRSPRGGELTAVSCTSASACTAVGNQNNGVSASLQALRWNGRKWVSQAMPSLAGAVGNSVSGVSCVSRTACVAVGGADVASDPHNPPLAETWNGRRWDARALPIPAGAVGAFLSGVSCVSRKACVAVGVGLYGETDNELPLAETWNGRAWTIRATPVPARALSAVLSGVSCGSPTSCIAVGDYTRHRGIGQHTLVEAWNGRKWLIKPTPRLAGILRSSLSGVSCSSAAACLAVGIRTRAGPGQPPAELPLVEAWNGRAWAVRAMPRPAGTRDGELSGVSCRSPTACSVAGDYTLGRGPTFRRLTLAETWNGRTWAIHHTPSPAGILVSSLSGVSCSSAAACVAVGSSIDPGGQETLAESWDGRRWVIHPTPFPLRRVSGASFLTGVSCTSPIACVAVGAYSTGGVHLLAEVWNGRRWVIRRPRVPAGARSSSLSAVSCTSRTACTAAGTYVSKAGRSLMLAEAWNGTRWAIQRTPRPPAGTGFSINAVSCTSARACTAVGIIQRPPPDNLQATTLAQRWNGKTWTVQPTPRRSQLVGVSCTSGRACTAVGGGGPNVMLAEVWNGRRWAVQPTPIAPPGSDPLIRGLSCASARNCAAVGETSVQGGGLAVGWNGKRWAIQPVPRPGDSQRTRQELFGVSCTPAACMAVGEYVNRLGHVQPLVERRR